MIGAKDIERTLWAGLDALHEEHASQEVGKVGTLRGGNAGCVTPVGIVGKCPRKTLLRFLGIEEPKPRDKAIMFRWGETNETFIGGLLDAAKVSYSRTDTVAWDVKLGDGTSVSVTGRPDMSIGKTGIELKMTCSTTRAVAAGGKAEPDTEHLVQSAVYFAQGGYEHYVLGYTSGSEYTLAFYHQKEIAIGCPNCTWNWKGRQQVPGKMLPFFSLFDLRFGVDGALSFQHTSMPEATKTLITKEGCEAYYRLIGKCASDHTIPPKHVQLDYAGKKNAHWNACDSKYCVFSKACANHDEYDDWFNACREAANNKGDTK